MLGSTSRSGAPCERVRGLPSWPPGEHRVGLAELVEGDLVDVRRLQRLQRHELRRGLGLHEVDDRLRPDALPAHVVDRPAGDAMEVARLMHAGQRRDVAPAQALRLLDEAGDAELEGGGIEASGAATARCRCASRRRCPAAPRRAHRSSGTALERKRLTAGATAMPPRPAANVPSRAARPNGMPARGVGVGRSIGLTVPLALVSLQARGPEFTPAS